MNLNKIKLFTFSVALVMAVQNCFASAIEGEEAVAFAGFIQDLVRTTHTSRNGVICAFGSDEISKVIASQDKKFIDLDREPKKFEQCKAVYIAQGREKNSRAEIEKYNSKKILTIGTFDGITDIGGMIQVSMGRRNFELTLNAKEVKAAGVRLNALATSLVIN